MWLYLSPLFLLLKIFWVITRRHFLVHDQRFGITCLSHLQGLRINYIPLILIVRIYQYSREMQRRPQERDFFGGLPGYYYYYYYYPGAYKPLLHAVTFSTTPWGTLCPIDRGPTLTRAHTQT
jgi:hypothetical protein